MPSVVFVSILVAISLTVQALRTRSKFRLARWCLWLALLVAMVAFKSGWVIGNLVTLSALIAFVIYVMIQDMRIAKDARRAASGQGRE